MDELDDFSVREGMLLSLDRGRAMVRVEQEEDCGGCRSCAVKALCRGRDSGHFDMNAVLPDGMAARPGDRVRVAYRSANPAVAALTLFIPPLAGLFLGGLTAHTLFESDGALLAGCLSGLILGLAATFAASRLGPLRLEARILPDAGPASAENV